MWTIFAVTAALADWDGGYDTCTLDGVYGWVSCEECAPGDAACTTAAEGGGKDLVCTVEDEDTDAARVGASIWCRAPTDGEDTEDDTDDTDRIDCCKPAACGGCSPAPHRRGAWLQAAVALGFSAGGGLLLRRRA